MDFLDVIIFSLVEGVTEFLPISSTGHLALAANLLNVAQTDFVKTFTIVIQLGAILAAITLYGRTLLKNKQLFTKVIIGFLPSGVIGLVSYSIIKEVLIGNELITVIALLLGGIALIVIERRIGTEKGTKLTLKSMTIKEALLIGLAQSLAVIPGVSRSASTIMGGLLVGMNRKSAVEFSFMLAIPTMIAAAGYEFFQSAHSFTQQNLLHLGVGMVISFVVAYAVMRWLLKFIQTNTLIPFGIYRIVIAIIFFIFVLL